MQRDHTSSRRLLLRGVLGVASAAMLLYASLPAAIAAGAEPASSRPVKIVADQRLAVTTAVGTGQLPLYVSQDWGVPRPDVTRAVIVLHGYRRNAETYLRTGQQAVAVSGVDATRILLVVPQFLTDADVSAHALPASTLRWANDGWEGGEDASSPAALSSFDALDAIMARLADRQRFPALKMVVVAGHSGGAQVAQRYAVLGRGGATLKESGVALRFVVSNPSSYAYFSPERPVFTNGTWTGRFATPGAPALCVAYNDWKYGLAKLPRYAAGGNLQLEAGYLSSGILYLLGTADTRTDQRSLDKTCMAEAQGPNRHARGVAYFASLLARRSTGFRQGMLEVPGVGHDERKMFGSACGLAALFDKPGCDLP